MLAALGTRLKEERNRVGLEQRQLAAALEVSRNSQLAYEGGKTPPPATYLLDLEKVGIDATYVLTGRRAASDDGTSVKDSKRDFSGFPQSGSGLLIDANDADWVEVPEYAMLELDETGRLEPIATAVMRRDWLYGSLGESSGLWIARLPAPYDAIGLNTGAPLICKHHRPGERMIDGGHYLFRVNGGVVMSRFAFRPPPTGVGNADRQSERLVLAQELGREEDQYQTVARVVGVLARPI